MKRHSLRGGWTPQRKCPHAVPTGLGSAFVEIAFPTLKRGANKRCACGAAARTLHLQFSLNAAVVFCCCGRSKFAPFQDTFEPCAITSN
jgi:hypothetical protein